VAILAVVQLYTGYYFMKTSAIGEEVHFVDVLMNRDPDPLQVENRDLANYINHLPKGSHVLIDDAIAYPVVAFTNGNDIGKLTLPYQGIFLTAIETPDKYDNYILLATANNEVTGFTQLNDRYVPVIQKNNSELRLRRVFETNDWILYKIFDK